MDCHNLSHPIILMPVVTIRHKYTHYYTYYSITGQDTIEDQAATSRDKEDEAVEAGEASTLLCHQSIEDWEENWLFRRKRPPGTGYF